MSEPVVESDHLSTTTFPASYGEEALWFIQQEPDASNIYNLDMLFKIHSEVSPTLLRDIFAQLSQRHPALRTTFTFQDDQIFQVVHEQQAVSFEEIDCSGQSWETIQPSLQQHRERPYDLEHGPIWRVTLFTMSPVHHMLWLEFHHIILDAWSFMLILDEFITLYKAAKHLPGAVLPPITGSCAEFAQWQRHQLDATGDQLRAYWQQELSGELPVLELPTDFPRPPEQTYQSASYTFRLENDLKDRVRALGRREGASFFAVILAAFQILLHRYSGQQEILTGIPTAGREQEKFDRTLGYFVNPLVVRSSFELAHNFSAFLQQVQTALSGAIQHRDYPFSWLVKDLHVARDSNRAPLCQAMVTWARPQAVGDEAVRLFKGEIVQVADLTLSYDGIWEHIRDLDILLELLEQTDGVLGHLRYRPDLYAASTIERMSGHFLNLLESILANPDQLVSELPLLSEAERQQLLVEWTDTQRDYPADQCVHQLFEAQVKRSPEAEAVVFAPHQVLTYRELNERANQLAHELRAQGVVSESVIGVFMERCTETVISLLAIFKAGGVYLPLDPRLPAERLDFILSNSNAFAILTQRKYASELHAVQAHIICLDADGERIAQHPVRNLDTPSTPKNLAYVIYTSGSTGRPKGAMVEQRGLVNHLCTKVVDLKLTPADRVAQIAPQSFDISMWQFLVALLAGGAVHIFDDDTVHNPDKLLDRVEDEHISVFQVVPSMFRFLLDDLALRGRGRVRPAFANLRWLVLAGEALPPHLCREWFSYYPDIALLNAYGPTECTDNITHHPIYEAPPADAVNVPIGRPLANLRLYILDAHLQPTPLGVPGELCVGGVGVGRGYLNDPERTAAVFMADPFVPEPEARFYKTGDLARFLPDGTIEYLGRLDHQVKIRGHRIELGEIETVLVDHPNVRQSLVTVYERDKGDKTLVAYLIPQSESDTVVSEVRQYLSEKLPHYMMPGAFFTLDAFPLSPHGKIDRKALPSPETGHVEVAQYVAPQTPIESVLATIWAGVLGVERVGLHDNFFDLGGHSLLATQIVSRVRDTFQVELPLRTVFEVSTIEALAPVVETSQRDGYTLPVAPPIEALPREGDMPLSFAQQRLWFLDQLEGSSATYNIPLALRLMGALNADDLAQALQILVQRHEVLRTTFPTVEGQPVQRVHAETLPLAVVDLQHLNDPEQTAELQRLLAQEGEQPFDLAQGPLLRVTLYGLRADQHVLLISMHHIITDGWSLGVMLQEWDALYQALASGQPASLPELPVQYADFSQWQRQRLRGDVLEAQCSYWQQHLADAPPLLNLPTDHPRPAVQRFQGKMASFNIAPHVAEALRSLSRQAGTSMFMTLYAAAAVLLSRYSGQTDLVLGTPIANRHDQAIEPLIGLFINTLALRVDLSGNPTFTDLLKRVRQVTLAGYAHQDIPFEQLLDELNAERSLSHTPLFQAMFVYEAVPLQPTAFDDVAVVPMAVERETAKFDLTLFLSEPGTYLDFGASEGLAGAIEYDTDLFEPATIQRLMGHFQQLLAGIVADPDQPIDALPLLTEGERRQLLFDWNETQMAYPEAMCFHQLFEAQVRRAPDALALVCEGAALTYAGLNQRANQLAFYLQDAGVGPEAVVGVCMERCAETLLSLLAIFKAGGAYMPLDPELPPERLHFMLTNSDARVVLTKTACAANLPPEPARIVDLDTAWERIACHSRENPLHQTTPNHLAYVIYTSGSTGLPKGAMVTQRGMVNHLYAKVADLDLRAADRVAETAPLSFDISIWQFLCGLLVGGSVHIIDADTVRTPAQLLDQVEAQRISILEVVPSLFRVMLDELNTRGAERPRFSALRWLLLTGEALPPHLCQEWFSHYPALPLMNAYGPTECSDDVTHYAITGPLPSDAPSVPIGLAVANTQLYILDAQLQPTPIGVPGALYVGGTGVGRGYLNDAVRTAAAFIPNPFGSERGACLYHTGDLARYLPDGDIEFLGRLDFQVKIRGFRIELGEIETLLTQHPEVRESLVIAHEAANGQPALLAYVVPIEASAVSIQALSQYLSQKLPGYMVPSAFVLLDAFPLSPNGKVDRRALPTPELSGFETGYEPPQTPTEDVLAAVWEEVLHLHRVGRHDDFFDLGGHSLLATQVISRIRSTFQVEMSIRTLFEHATIATLGRAVETAQLGEEALPVPPPILPAPRDRELPLSFVQQRLWFLDQFEGPSATYNIPVAFRLTGGLQTAALELSLNALVQRHEVLRTTFPNQDGQPVQQIHSALHLPLTRVDLQHLEAPAQQAELDRLLDQAAKQPFDLALGPLLRVTLYHLSADTHILLINLHHIIGDLWSLGILMQELSTSYQAAMRGEPSPLAALTLQYADFAKWQRAWLTGEVLEQQLDYWQHHLADAPTLLDLPTDYPRPLEQTFNGRIEPFEIAPDLAEQLRRLSRESGTSMFMTLYSAFAVLLSRYSGQEDVVIGTPIAHRHYQEVEPLIGFFLNTLALRTDLSGDPGFVDLLKQVRQVTLDAHAHQDIPFEQLVDELAVERQLNHAPLFQVMFVWQGQRPTLALEAVEVELLELTTETAKFDLTLFLAEAAPEAHGGLTGLVEYNTDLFDAATIGRFISHFQQLITGIVADPHQPVKHVPLLTEAERQHLLVTWNDTQSGYPSGTCVHQLFEAQVERTPDAVAVVFGQTQWRYRELNQRANQLAHRLQSLGVGPDVLVGVCLERCPEMAVAILAILKAGGAYVPLDPAYPQDRLRFMLENADVSVLLTQAAMRPWLSPPAQTITLDIDHMAADLTAESPENPSSGVTPDNLLYVIYTSGSTGRPKGVAMRHQPLTNLVWWQHAQTPMAEGARTLQFTPISFDVSCQELFSTWCFGGTLVLISDETRRDGDALLDELHEQRIERLFLPFVALQNLAESVKQSRPPAALRHVITAGEPLQVTPAIAQWFSQTNCRLHNQYGPAETHVVTAHTLSEAVETWPPLPPIGRPVANTQVYVLDDAQQPVPIGVVGELYLGGDALARGYLHDPDLTWDKFIANPFAPGRLYRTGDLARYLPGGDIAFLGRADDQVKIRGFRVELGEIETALSQHSAVQEAVVSVREGTGKLKQLVAYVVTGGEWAALVADLRTQLRQTLPDYMMPAAFVKLDDLPLTPSGKVNRRALPAPEQSGIEAGYAAPQTPAEDVIAAVWTEVLGLHQVGRDDNFFDLGGHSLLATQVISRLRDAFQVDLPVRTVFESATIAELAQTIGSARQRESVPMAPPIQATERHGDIPLSFAQQRLWFIERLEGPGPNYNLPLILRLTGELAVEALERALNELVRRHEVLRTTFPSVEDNALGAVQRIASEWDLSLQHIDLTQTAEREQELAHLLEAEAQRPFDLARGPLLRVTLYALHEREHVLVVNMHHIISDGWSLKILWHEVETLYQTFAQGEPSPLPDLALQYADFSKWQRAWLQGEVLDHQLAYWRQHLAGAPPLLELPTDHPRPPLQSYHGQTERFELEPQLATQLRALSRRFGVSPFMTLYGAFAVLLYRYSGQEDIVIGTPIANRHYRELEPLIGFFVNTLALRVDLSGDPSFADLLSQVRQVTLDAYTHQDIPFEQLVGELDVPRNLSHAPVFQVMLSITNIAIDELGLGTLEVAPVDFVIDTATFDLTLALEEWESESTGGLRGDIEYNTDLFERPTILRMIHHLKHLLNSIVSDPAQPIHALSLLTEVERHQLLTEWHTAAPVERVDACVHHVFEAQVERTPDALAVIGEGASLTYRQLNDRANQLAHHLQALGVAPEAPVGLCVTRSVDMVAGLFGIWKSGGAYIPLDPDYPAERLAFILADTQAQLVVTQEPVAAGLEAHGVQLVRLGEAAMAQQPVHNPVNRVEPGQLAYIIYTSGSTGQPKGVLIEHGALVNHCRTMQSAYGLTAADGVLQFAATHFDVSLEQLLPPLLAGANVVLGGLWPPSQFHKKVQEFGLTVADLPPAYCRQMLEIWVDDPALMHHTTLRLLIVGGDAAPPELAACWQRAALPSVRLLNAYGPTEATITATVFDVPRDIDPARYRQSLPIGRPLANRQVYILDANLQPVPTGVPGELYLGGDGLARGYLNRPELTESAFIDNPFGAGRLYKTGDRVRYLPDRAEPPVIEFLGRVDQQVKIRGFRIEVGEIETVLREHPEVREAVVIVPEKPSGDKRLVAYVVLQQPTAASSHAAHISALRTHLRQTLPEYMIPAAFVLPDHLPLSPNGSVDRRALATRPLDAESLLTTQRSHPVLPRSDLEKAIATIWRDVLGLDTIGVQDNFFEVGGHSLLALQVHTQLLKTVTETINIIDLFHYPTIASLARYLSQSQQQQPAAPDDSNRSQTRRDAFRQRAAQQSERRNRTRR